MPDMFVAKIPDRAILAMIVELGENFGSDHVNVDMGGIQLPQDQFESIMSRKGVSYLIHSFAWNSGQSKISISMNRASIIPSLNPAYYDQITVSPQPNRSATVADLVGVEETIRRHVTMPKASDAKELASSTIGIIDRETAALAQLHHTMLENAEELRAKYEDDAADRRRKFEEQQLQAEEEIRKREAESLERIGVEKAALAEKIGEFDQSDHMFARRKLRDDITTQVQGFLLRSPSNSQSRYKLQLFLIMCLLGAAISAAAAVYSFQSFITLAQDRSEIASDLMRILENTIVDKKSPQNSSLPTSSQLPNQAQTPATNGGGQSTEQLSGMANNIVREVPDNTFLLWMLALRGLILSVVTVGFIAYLVSFLRRSYDEEVRTLQQLQRYGMDINRASWVIETAMEMTTKEGATLPERWVEGACAGLFQSGQNKEEVSSLAALGAVMGLGPEVTVGPSGASFKIPAKGAKKAANDAE